MLNLESEFAQPSPHVSVIKASLVLQLDSPYTVRFNFQCGT